MRDESTDSLSQVAVDCDCYRCIGSITRYTEDGHQYVVNNVHIENCENCDRIKTEFVDNYTKGHYECWWCNERAAGPFGPESAPPTGGIA